VSTKKNPGQFDCYANAEPEEPLFIVLARDKDAPLLVRMWAMLREGAIENGAKPISDMTMVHEARQIAYQMDRWRRANRGDDRQGILTMDEMNENEALMRGKGNGEG
jgi:hypothetical protein